MPWYALSLLPVAENLKQPLYRLIAADLRSNIAASDTRLNEALTRCAASNVVSLIDEADVFFEDRGTVSLEKNELVSNESMCTMPSSGTS
jgi:hypothetical protein